MNKIGFNTTKYFETPIGLNEIKNLLEKPNSEKDNMEGLRYLFAGLSQGKDVSSVYPSVAKLVVSQNNEIKKLVSIYLTHYAEAKPDDSLLAISTFKKELTNPNPFVRANALRILSSIRNRLIAPVIGLALKKATTDLSPYVKKVAAFGCSKLYSLDPEQTDLVIEVIGDLLNDHSLLVLSAAVMAFNEVCPNRFDLIHPNFRKICNSLCDMEEWGLIQCLQMLIRYARTFFKDPFKAEQEKLEKKRLKKNEDESDDDSDSDDDYVVDKTSLHSMDPDLRLILSSTAPLFRHKNVSVVHSAVTLFFYLSPHTDTGLIAKTLIRLIKTRPYAKFIVLSTILTMTTKNPAMFRPYLNDFFVHVSDPLYIKKLKINIMSQIADDTNISKILREFKFYVNQEDEELVKVTIQAIGRCASNFPSVTETCMHCLTSLIGNPVQTVVAESIIVIKQLLQISTTTKINYDDVIRHVAKLLDDVSDPNARASIIWIVGEYVKKLKKIAPDVLRKLAKSFPEEDKIVKLQILNLGCKLFLTNPEQTTKLFQYILSLARYDVDYDIRDRYRVIRMIVVNPNNSLPTLHGKAEELLITKKPVPVLLSPTTDDGDGEPYFPGSISSIIGHKAAGYTKIPDWAEENSASELREVVKKESGTSVYSNFGGSSGMVSQPKITGIGYKSEDIQRNMSTPQFAPQMNLSPTNAYTIAGFSSREEYERKFWGDDSDDDEDDEGDDGDSSDSSSDTSDDSDSDTDSDSDSDTSESDTSDDE